MQLIIKGQTPQLNYFKSPNTVSKSQTSVTIAHKYY